MNTEQHIQLISCPVGWREKVYHWVLECWNPLGFIPGLSQNFAHLCATEWCGNPASPGALQLGFHLAFCYAQNEPLCALLHRPRSKGNSEHTTPQRSRCLEISNQGNKWSTSEMLLSSIRETSVLFQSLHDLFIYLLLVEVFLSTTAGHLEKNINCVKEKWSYMSSTEKAIISKCKVTSLQS